MVPNNIHFVYGMLPPGGDRPFSLVHAIAVESAWQVHRPDALFVHGAYPPTGPHWERIAHRVTWTPTPVPTHVFGHPVDRAEHRADLVRLHVLMQHGGIYLDLDTISVRSLTPLRQHECVIGVERTPDGRHFGLSNAVLMAAPRARFLRRWHESYRTFNQDYWNVHSVVVPRFLAQQAEPDELHVEPVSSFHRPSYTPGDLRRLFVERHHFPEAYVHHLWESAAWDPYLQHLTPERIRTEETTYNLLARRYL